MQGEDPKEQQWKGPRLRSGKDKLLRLERGRLQQQQRQRQEKNRVNQMILSPFLVWVPEQTVRLSKGLQRRILRLIPRLKVEGQQLLLQQHLCGRHHPQQILQTTYLRYLEEVLIIPNSITLLLQFGSFNLHFVDLCSFSSHVI
jgi:hypothetical protein